MEGRTDPAAEAWKLMFRIFMASKPQRMHVAHELGLSPMQLHALSVLQPGEEVPMSALAEQLVCDASNVTGIVDRLEARGLIERRADARDRRVKMLALTSEGVGLREEATRRMMQPPPELAALSRRDQRTLLELLRRATEPDVRDAAA
jgi:DNA-binding MarR family transcriptional regulator